MGLGVKLGKKKLLKNSMETRKKKQLQDFGKFLDVETVKIGF